MSKIPHNSAMTYSPEPPHPASPVEKALDSALGQSGSEFGTALNITSREYQALLRHIARMLNSEKHEIMPAELLHALCLVRQKSWASLLMNKSHRRGDVWVRRTDVLEAAGRIGDPLASEDALFDALDVVLEERWRETGPSPSRVLEEVRADMADSGHFLSSGQTERLSHSIARAFGGVDMGFEDALLLAEEQHSREQALIHQRAEERKRRELQRLEQWEKSLLGFEDVPALLHCSRKEALRWIAEGRLPVAKRHGMEDGREEFFFDPAELKKCRALLPHWRKGQDGPTIPGIGHSARPQHLDSPVFRGNKKANAAIARVAALDRFAAHFRTARALKRRLTLVTGPTNSGKSYTALKALAEAESGLALAPLRLLAHEFREALLSRGVATSLTTGEERMIDPTARHLAATVEMCPFYKPVDVAIIDEAQMLTDPDRGAAWTAAIMGVPARHVFILGAADCSPLVKRIAELCNDPVDELHLERKSPLIAGPALTLEELRHGDALIAFSRRDVLALRAELGAMNRKVAVIYGALSPEVRRAEAARFNRGEAEILVATDAIGMGLNLSIRRVIFSTLRKYDGRQTRSLTAQEVKQIGGRAGRFGKHERGIVSVLGGAGSTGFIRQMLAAPPERQAELRPLVQPDSDIVQAVAREIGTESLYAVLARIKHAVLRPDDPNYRLADMEQPLEIAAALEGVENLDLQTRWVYAMCPVNTRDNGVLRLVEWASYHAKGRRIHPSGTGSLPDAASAGHDDLERAEKRHRRLVTWRWLAMRFPDFYPELEQAERNAAILDDWIEKVLRTQSRQRETTRRRNLDQKGFRETASTKKHFGKNDTSSAKSHQKRRKRPDRKA